MEKGVDASHLPDASEVTSEDTAVVAFSQVLDCVHRANGELVKPRDALPGYDAEQDHVDFSERLREWLQKLHPTMKAIIHYLPHAASYSFTFGTTISMTVNFIKRADEDGPPTAA